MRKWIDDWANWDIVCGSWGCEDQMNRFGDVVESIVRRELAGEVEKIGDNLIYGRTYDDFDDGVNQGVDKAIGAVLALLSPHQNEKDQP